MPKKKTITDMYKLGLLYGDILTYKDDPTITAKVVASNKIEYQGKEYSLSMLVYELKHPELDYRVNRTRRYNGWEYWLFNGDTLVDRRSTYRHHRALAKMKSITEKKKLDKKP